MRHVRAIALAALALSVWALAAGRRVRRRHGVHRRQHVAGEPPGARASRVGAGLLIIGFEFEYSDTTDDPAAAAPSLKTGMGNMLLQTPVAFSGVQPYFTVGGGVYHEELGAVSNTGFVGNTGGGVKISLVGPVRLRVDYRAVHAQERCADHASAPDLCGTELKF